MRRSFGVGSALIVWVLIVWTVFVAWVGHQLGQRDRTVRVEAGSALHNQASPMRFDDEHRPDWIGGNLALGIAVGTEPGAWRPEPASVGDFALLQVDHKTGAVLARCVEQ